MDSDITKRDANAEAARLLRAAEAEVDHDRAERFRRLAQEWLYMAREAKR